MTRDRQLAAAAERRPPARTINIITPTRTRAPSRSHSHRRPEPEPLPAAGEPLACAVVGAEVGALLVDEGSLVAVAVVLGLEAITLGLEETLTLGLGDELGLDDELVLCAGEALTLRLGAMLAIALFTELPHPATMHPATRMAAESRRPLISRRMLILPGFNSLNRLIGRTNDDPACLTSPASPARGELARVTAGP